MTEKRAVRKKARPPDNTTGMSPEDVSELVHRVNELQADGVPVSATILVMRARDTATYTAFRSSMRCDGDSAAF